MRLRLLLILALLSVPVLLAAQQDQHQFLVDASAEYELGHFETVEDILKNRLDELDTKERIDACRLLSLSCMYMDKMEAAEYYAGMLLELDPFFSAYGESPRYADMLSRLKIGAATVTTASKIAESMEEVPVPMTVITSDMIRASGAIKLQDILLLYLPGFSAISSLDDDCAMRGVYGTGQETILVLLDGHRLNSSTTNAEPFDFRNSVDKIKQIEILRGPASSLYGNFALTAVVNIITKSGTDLDGGRISVMTGSNSTIGGTAMFGKGNIQSDFMAWMSIYNSKGQASQYGGTTHYIEGYNTKPTFDLGARLRWGDIQLEVTGQHCHPVPYFNLLAIGDKFTYDKYGTVNGEGPGVSRTNIRADIDYSHSWKNFSLSASGFISSERQQLYNAMADTADYQIMAYLAKMLNIPSVKTQGVRQIFTWEDYGFGASVSGAWNYKFKGGMHGSTLLGLQYENLMVGDASLFIGADYNQTNNVKHDILYDGMEHTLSAFFQLKHYFTPKLIFNGGLRYDYKARIDGNHLNTVSPRISLIWLPNQVITVKGCYSHAFVDAAMFYRGSKISLFSGGGDLKPEKMDSFQLDVKFNWKGPGLSYDVNLFHNNVSDLVYYGMSESGTSAFVNAGKMSVGGIENVFQYHTERNLVNLNCTYQHPFAVENFATVGNNIANVPNFLLNLTAQRALVVGKRGGKLWARANAHFQSGFNCLENDLLKKISDPTGIYSYWQKEYVVVGAGLEWEGFRGLQISVDLYNLTNTAYEIGGQLLRGVPGLGRSCMVRVGYNF